MNRSTASFALRIAALAGFGCSLCLIAFAGDQPQWGQRHTRNMVSSETGLPVRFDPESGDGLRWTVDLGNQAYGTPVVSQGRVFIGTNNSVPFDPRHEGTHGVLLCLDDRDGALEWQLVVPRRLGDDGFLDQPRIALCSPPTVEGDRVYVVTNRAEVVCLDLHGMTNGNDGPFRDEGQYMVQPGSAPKDVTQTDADILWVFDMPSQAGIHPHDSPHSSILIDGKYLYLNTGNGVDLTHRKIRKPDAPSLIVLDKSNGRLVGQDDERIGPRIFHCTWSSPAMGTVDGKPLLFFCGGDGVVYAFEPLAQQSVPDEVQMLKRVWHFDCDPDGPKEDVHQYVGNRTESPSNIMGMPVFYKDRIYVCGGGDFWWGKREAFVKCIDATLSGDITETGEVWSQSLQRHSCTTPAIVNDLVFVGDLGRSVYCLDVDSGQVHWEDATRGPVWSTLMVANGKLYVGSGDKRLYVFNASERKELIATTLLDSPIFTTPVAANGRLYVNTLCRLYAVGQ
jgi:outer membrane protein assembly factor BamB